MAVVERIDYWMTWVAKWAATIAFIGIALCVCLGVVSRWLNISIKWTEEMARYCMIWFVYTAAVTGHQYIENTCVDVIFQKIPNDLQKVIRTIFRIAMIGFLLLLMKYGIDYAVLGFQKKMVTLPVSIFWVRLAIPVGCALMSLKWLFIIILSYKKEDEG